MGLAAWIDNGKGGMQAVIVTTKSMYTNFAHVGLRAGMHACTPEFSGGYPSAIFTETSATRVQLHKTAKLLVRI